MLELYVYIKDNEIIRCLDTALPEHEHDGCIEHYISSNTDFQSVELDEGGNIVILTNEDIMQKLNNGDIS